MPQKLSGGGQGDRFVPLYLLADKSKGDRVLKIENAYRIEVASATLQ